MISLQSKGCRLSDSLARASSRARCGRVTAILNQPRIEAERAAGLGKPAGRRECPDVGLASFGTLSDLVDLAVSTMQSRFDVARTGWKPAWTPSTCMGSF